MKKPAYKLDKVKKAQWLESYKKSNANVSRASYAVGLSRKTIYDCLDFDKKFANDKKEIDEFVIDVVESRAFKMTENNPAMNIFYLCNRRPERWRNVQNVEHTGKVGVVSYSVNFLIDPQLSSGNGKAPIEIENGNGKSIEHNPVP